MSDEATWARFVAILESHDRSEKKAVIVPYGQSLDFDVGEASRKWLRPHLGYDFHLLEFIPISEIRQQP